MKKIAIASASLLLLAGCAPLVHNGSISQEEQLRIMARVDASRKSAAENFQNYVDICRKEFPDAADIHNNYGAAMSDQWAVNVALTSGGRNLVCSVSMDTMQVERVHQANRTLTLAEYKAYLDRNTGDSASSAAVATIEPDPPESDPRLSYKNTRLGDSKARFASKLPLYNCKDGSCMYIQTSCESAYSTGPRGTAKECADGTSYGGAKLKNGFAYFIDGKLSKINLTISTDQMAVLDATLTEKYGKPAKVDSTPFMNKMGNTLPNTEKTWVVQGEKLVLTYRSTVVDEGRIEISGKAAEAQTKEYIEKRIKANSKDF